MPFRNWLPALTLASVATAALGAPPPGYFVSLAVYRPSTHTIYAYADLTTQTYALNGTYGQSGDIPVVGDFDGNGIYDLAVYRSGTWYTDKTHTLTADPSPLSYGGVLGDVPLAGDFDGDGISDLVIYRSGIWYIRSSKTGTTATMTFGGSTGDVPVIGDFDGDGIPDIAVFNAGNWTIRMSSTATNVVAAFGAATDVPCAADWDHDGRADLCVFRNGVWYFESVGASGVLDSYAFGQAGDIPLAGGAFDANAIFVRAGASGTQNGSLMKPYATISQARNVSLDGSVIRVAPGTYTETLSLYGPMVGPAGKNNIKLLGAGRCRTSTHACPAILAPSSGDGLTFQGSTGDILENFRINAAASNARGIVLSSWNFNASQPGAVATIAFNSIVNPNSYGILITGQSEAVITHNAIIGSVNASGIGMQQGPPDNPTQATIAYNEIANNGPPSTGPATGANGIEGIASTLANIVGNDIHDNTRMGIIGVGDAHMTISANTIHANVLDGVILCGPNANDPSTATITGNTISGNGTYGGDGYNGVEFYATCVGAQVVSGNTFAGNSLNGIYIGSGTLDVSNNTFSNNLNGITVQAGTLSSTSTVVRAFGNEFINNPQDGIYSQLDAGAPHELIATIGGTQSGQVNYFSGQGFHAIGCSAPSRLLLNCPAGGNTFVTAGDNVESTCNCDDIFHSGFGP
jgi:hypothetical protein